MKQMITAVRRGSAAWRAGLRKGDAVLTVGGEPLLDQIDYQALTASDTVKMEIERSDGSRETLMVRKDDEDGLGLSFGEAMTLSPRSCHNKCAFCFIDQMPKGLRPTLYVKDDDWRFSLMMGNFVTLTNVDDAEFDRILRRHATPLYVSVHSTNPALRCRMMNNRFAGDILDRLGRLKKAGIHFHCQIVVCPGYNDKAELLRTLRDLRDLAPAAATVAMVPVGLTKCRDGLAPLTPFTKESAAELLDEIAPFQEECRRTMGTTFAFPSDEFFCLAGRPVPEESWYEDYPQIENGVGLLRQLESQMEEAAAFDDEPAAERTRRLLIPTGVSAAPHLKRLCERFAPDGTEVRVRPIQNRFFGGAVTVTGLLTGGDILAQLSGEDLAWADTLLLSCLTLRAEGDLFLDDMSLEDFARKLPMPVTVVQRDGQSLYDALRG